MFAQEPPPDFGMGGALCRRLAVTVPASGTLVVTLSATPGALRYLHPDPVRSDCRSSRVVNPPKRTNGLGGGRPDIPGGRRGDQQLDPRVGALDNVALTAGSAGWLRRQLCPFSVWRPHSERSSHGPASLRHVRMCANKVGTGVRCSALLPNIRSEGTCQFASAQQINQLEGLAVAIPWGFESPLPHHSVGTPPSWCVRATQALRGGLRPPREGTSPGFPGTRPPRSAFGQTLCLCGSGIMIPPSGL